jgi:quinoprotein glucose dehydrogenase
LKLGRESVAQLPCGAEDILRAASVSLCAAPCVRAADRVPTIPNLVPQQLACFLAAAVALGTGFPLVKLKAAPAADPHTTQGGTNYWAVEDPIARESLPAYRVIPAARHEDLTPAAVEPDRSRFQRWNRSHADNAGTRYSGLSQIHRGNVGQLRPAWTYHSNDARGNIQCNPVIVGDLMFAPTPGKCLVAIEAATGVERWRFKPEGRPAFRGLIGWPGLPGATNRLFFCAGQHLYALDAVTGTLIHDFGTGGRVALPGRAQGDFGVATAAPAVFDRVVIVPGFEKDVWGVEALTGRVLWTFHTVPEPGEPGHETWDRVEPYAANCWGGMALDETRGIAYLTTGSPKENFVGVDHRGQNLYANCVLALDARTGRHLWHFQEVAHDIWDLDIPAPPNLVTVLREGRRVDVVTAVTKIGNTLVLDRVTGKPLFPFRLRRAPASELRGEVTWPYQPDVETPEPFAKQDFTIADITDRSEEATDYVTGRFKSATTGWFRPFTEGKMNLYFGLHGGAEWTGACVDPMTSRLYVSANHIPWIISVFRDDDPPDDPQAPRTRGREVYEMNCAQCHGTNRIGLGTCPPLRGLRQRLTAEAVTNQVRQGKNSMPAHPDMTEGDLAALVDYLMLRDRPVLPMPSPGERPRYSFNGYPKFLDHEGYPASKPPWGTLNCIDLNTGRLVWRVPLGEHEELTRQGIPLTGTENFGGAMVTAGGLVFVSGTRDCKIRAFDSQTGAELWSARLPWAGSAPPAGYEVNGRQFIVIPATGGGKLGMPTGDAYVAFALPTGVGG